MEGLIKRWGDSLGTPEEAELGKSVAEGVKDLSFGLGDGDPLPPVLEALLPNLLALLTTSISSIFPLSDQPPPAPPPSLLPILSAAREHFFSQPQAIKACNDLRDELRAAAVGEYVVVVDQMMGGVGQDGEADRKVGENGKDEMIEGFEKVALWMDREVANVRKVWGEGVGA